MSVHDIAKRFHLIQDKAEISRVFPISATKDLGMKDALTAVMNEAKITAVVD